MDTDVDICFSRHIRTHILGNCEPLKLHRACPILLALEVICDCLAWALFLRLQLGRLTSHNISVWETRIFTEYLVKVYIIDNTWILMNYTTINFQRHPSPLASRGLVRLTRSEARMLNFYAKLPLMHDFWNSCIGLYSGYQRPGVVH